MKGSIGTTNQKKIRWIRDENHIKDIFRYYEYMQFKKGKFKCTGVTYDDINTGRINGLSFKFTG